MTRIICIAGLPCVGKTTLGNNLAEHYNCLSLDLEYLRTIFFEKDFENNLYKYTHNEPIKENENLRDYFLRCVIYDNILTLDEYVVWYRAIMVGINELTNAILEDFENLNYDTFLTKHANVIKCSPSIKPRLIIINHALLPLTDIWNNSIRVMLSGEDSKIISRFVVRERIKPSRRVNNSDILRHINMYKELINKAESDIFYDTSACFMTVKEFDKIYKTKGV